MKLKLKKNPNKIEDKWGTNMWDSLESLILSSFIKQASATASYRTNDQVINRWKPTDCMFFMQLVYNDMHNAFGNQKRRFQKCGQDIFIT